MGNRMPADPLVRLTGAAIGPALLSACHGTLLARLTLGRIQLLLFLGQLDFLSKNTTRSVHVSLTGRKATDGNGNSPPEHQPHTNPGAPTLRPRGLETRGGHWPAPPPKAKMPRWSLGPAPRPQPQAWGRRTPGVRITPLAKVELWTPKLLSDWVRLAAHWRISPRARDVGARCCRGWWS